jgi:hypothetical protein
MLSIGGKVSEADFPTPIAQRRFAGSTHGAISTHRIHQRLEAVYAKIFTEKLLYGRHEWRPPANMEPEQDANAGMIVQYAF